MDAACRFGFEESGRLADVFSAVVVAQGETQIRGVIFPSALDTLLLASRNVLRRPDGRKDDASGAGGGGVEGAPTSDASWSFRFRLLVR